MRQRRTRFEAMSDKRQAQKKAEAAGLVADSMDVRLDIVRRIQAGTITPEQGNAELAAIKRGAKKAGKVTMSQAFNAG